MLDIKIKKLNEKATVPMYQTDGAAAADLYACVDWAVMIEPGETALIPTGVAMAIPAGTVGLVFARSGLAVKKGISLANSVGVIDSDYRGEIKVGLKNTSREPFTVNRGDRIAQIAFMPVCAAKFTEADELDETERGDGGFGHTGK